MAEKKDKIFRADLLRILEVSNTTLCRYIKKYESELEGLGYKEGCRRFSKKVVNFLHEKFWGETYF